MNQDFNIISTGIFLPKKVSSEEICKKNGDDLNYVLNNVGVKTRYVADENQTVISMAANAVKDAIKDKEITLEEIDCFISASASVHQLIPCTAALIKEELGLQHSSAYAFDINSTCLGFVTAFDVAINMLPSYKTIAIISSEKASAGINWDNIDSSYLFGDGAVCVIIRLEKNSKKITSVFKNYCIGARDTQVQGGAMNLPAYKYKPENAHQYLFEMNGRKVYSLTVRKLQGFLRDLESKSQIKTNELDLVIPHQASGLALKSIQKKLNLRDDQFCNIISDYGNMIAASIPLALHLSIKSGKIKKGDTVALLGTSAGFSIGGFIFTY